MTDFIPATIQDDEAKLAEQRKAMDAMYLASQTQEATKELAAQLKYQGSLNPDVLEDGIRESQARIGAEIFQIGARLVLIKEQSQHGEFQERLQRLDIHPRVAQRFMQVSVRFSNATISSHLQKMGKSKVLELLVLEDQEIEELAEEGSVRGLELDEIDRMPVSELRKKLREEKNKSEGQDRLLKTRQDTIDKLLLEVDGPKATLATPDQELTKLHQRLSELSKVIQDTLTSDLRGRFAAIADHHIVHGGSSDQILLGHINQISNELADLRDAFLLAEVADGKHAWETWNEENPLNPVDENQLDMLEPESATPSHLRTVGE